MQCCDKSFKILFYLPIKPRNVFITNFASIEKVGLEKLG